MSLPLIDYVVVAASLVCTTSVGLYCAKSNKGTLEDYMFGGRRMSILPITLSITATVMTSNALIGVGQEAYMYGAQISIYVVALGLGTLFAAYFYVPVLYNIESVSPYEFFDRRYSSSNVRKVISVINLIDTLQYIVISLYIPSLTFSQATGIDLFKIACFLAAICFIYTITGGLKAVAWADSFQMTILMTCAGFFLIMGLIKAGGVSEVWRLNEVGYRLELFNFNPSPFQRTTFWTTFGVFFMWTPNFLSSAQHQRYKSLPKQSDAKKVLLLTVGLVSFICISHCTLGLVVYAYFAGCDPVLAKEEILSYSTIIPYFINKVAVDHSGMAGLFYADVIAAGLSTTTSLWNTLACTIHEDLIRPFMKPYSDKQAHRIIVMLVAVIAVITTVSTKGVGVLGTINEASVALRTTTVCSIFVLFNTGMFLPWINSKGIVAGGLSAAVTAIVVVIGNVASHRTGLVIDYPKILTTENCSSNITSANVTYGIRGYGSHTVSDESVFWLFKIPFWYLHIPGIVVGIVVSIVVSWLTGFQDLETVDPQMIVPQMRWLLPKKRNTFANGEKHVVKESKESYNLVPQNPPEVDVEDSLKPNCVKS